MKTIIIAAALATCASSAFAESSNFQQTCSNIEFTYLGSDAGISAVCLKSDGTPNATTIAIKGIVNNNGIMTQENSEGSTFQQSCGDIEIQVSSPDFITLTALCRNSAGLSQPTSIDVPGISNKDGTLSY